MKHFTDQEIEEAIQKVPKFIQDAVSSGEDLAMAIAQIGKKYQLHIDQIGVLAELNRNMLLGLIGPEDFLKEMIATGINERHVHGIMTEINQNIFIPLRKEEEFGQSDDKVHPVVSVEPPRPVAPPRAPGVATPAPVRAVMPPVRAAQPLPSGIPLPQEQIKRISNLTPCSATPPPPVNLPGSMPPAPAPAPAPQQKPVARPPITAYSIDPYREPLDEVQ